MYVKSSVFGYLVQRPDKNPIVFGHQVATQEWWIHHRHRSSRSSLQKFGRNSAGDSEIAKQPQKIARSLRWAQIGQNAEMLTRALVERSPIPPNAAADAAHIALATVHNIEFLVTWNFVHIANAGIREWIRSQCLAREFEKPTICAPEDLIHC